MKYAMGSALMGSLHFARSSRSTPLIRSQHYFLPSMRFTNVVYDPA